MLSLNVHLDFKRYQLNTQLDIAEGEIIGLFGKSGIGKTTLLKVIAGLDRPKNAKISLGGSLWNDEQEGVIAPPQKRSVGMVFQDFALFPNLTVEDNLRFSQKISDTTMHHLIDTLDIKNILDQKPNNISGGQKQRVAIGRAIAYDPKVLLMDEPFAALDEEIKGSIKTFLKAYVKEKGKIAIMASHDLEDIKFFDSKIIQLAE